MRLGITLGEPAGIGLELLSQLDHELDNCVLIGDARLIHSQLPRFPTNRIADIRLAETNVLGQLNTANARYVLDTIKTATLGCLDGRFVRHDYKSNS